MPKIEFEKFAKHYHKFNISALVDVAVRAAGNGAKTCTIFLLHSSSLYKRLEINLYTGVELVKSTEDQYYKACLMKMDNGEVVVAKLLSPNVGPAFYTIASEVATRQFVRSFFPNFYVSV